MRQSDLGSRFSLKIFFHLMNEMFSPKFFKLNTILLQMLAGQMGFGALQQNQGEFLSYRGHLREKFLLERYSIQKSTLVFDFSDLFGIVQQC
jgi:hypothetical protein